MKGIKIKYNIKLQMNKKIRKMPILDLIQNQTKYKWISKKELDTLIEKYSQ